MNFQHELLNWYRLNKRDLPWRNTTDPYTIWLSEIILQQTRVDQGLPYFNRFLEHFPTVQSFAQASENQVLKLWQGLGYYSRGRNMLYTAQYVMNNYNGVFPVSYKELIGLKGVGEYTAAAISSFANNEPKAVLDGNVFRVLARYFGIADPMNSTTGKRIFTDLAQHLIEDQPPAIYNQAIMEFGALHCKPKLPLCQSCPLQSGCVAFKTNSVNFLPVKVKKLKIRERWLNYFVCRTENKIAIKQRQPGDIWQQLYDFPGIETPRAPENDQLSFAVAVKEMFGSSVKIMPLLKKRHLLTHQIIYLQFFALDNYMINFNLHSNIKLVTVDEFKTLPHPKVIGDFIEMYL